jgi:hypothetical protein
MALPEYDHRSRTGHKTTHQPHKVALPDIEAAPELADATQMHGVERTPQEMTPAALMNIQRIQGNQAATRVISRVIQRQAAGAGAAQSAAKAKPTQVSISKTDMPYGWTAKYQVQFTSSECLLNVKVKLAPDPKVTKADLKQVREQTNQEFRRIFDNKFKLTDKKTNKAYNLRVSISFVSSGEHVTIKVHAGSGHDNLSNWYVKSKPIDRAHEMGHQIGLKDEYVDASAPNRKDGKAPGVFKDNSIMGNYYDEGISKARAKLRHGRVLAADIGSKTGHSFTASMIPQPKAPSNVKNKK